MLEFGFAEFLWRSCSDLCTNNSVRFSGDCQKHIILELANYLQVGKIRRKNIIHIKIILLPYANTIFHAKVIVSVKN